MAALSDWVADQRSRLGSTLDATAQTLDGAGRASDGLDASLGEARRSTERAAGLTRDVSATMAELGRAMQLEIFGQRPLSPAAGGFDRASGQLRDLGSDLDGIATALGRNAGDLRTSRDDLLRLRDEVRRLRDAVAAAPSFDATRAAVGTLRIVLYTLIAWLALLAAACLALGVALLRVASRP